MPFICCYLSRHRLCSYSCVFAEIWCKSQFGINCWNWPVLRARYPSRELSSHRVALDPRTHESLLPGPALSHCHGFNLHPFYCNAAVFLKTQNIQMSLINRHMELKILHRCHYMIHKQTHETEILYICLYPLTCTHMHTRARG